MLDDLTDMCVAEKIMKTKAKESTDLMEKRFQQLNLTELTPLESSSREFQHLSDYPVKSSSAGHGLQYEVLDVFRLERMGEFDRFDKSFSNVKSKNRLLLWHGSRSTNFGGQQPLVWPYKYNLQTHFSIHSHVTSSHFFPTDPISRRNPQPRSPYRPSRSPGLRLRFW